MYPPVYYYSPKKTGTPEIWRKTCDLKNDFVFLHPNITDGKFFGKSKKSVYELRTQTTRNKQASGVSVGQKLCD